MTTASGRATFCVSSGIRSLDDKLAGGFRRGSITCLGAQSGHGKTTLAMQFSYHAANTYPDCSVILLSPEMRFEDLAEMAVLSNIGRSRQWLARNPGELKREHVRRAALESTPPNLMLMQMPREVDQPVLDEVMGRLALAHSTRPIAMICLDYAQFLIGEIDEGKRQRFALAGDIVKAANWCAERFGCAVLMTSQVNAIKDKGKVVDFTMRESALFEHASATVMYYVREFDDDGEETASKFLIRKNRYGSLGTISVRSVPGCYRVEEQLERF